MNRNFINDKIKVEGLKRKKRRIRLKAKAANEQPIERFIAQSSKSAKYAKTTVKKRDASASAAESMRRVEGAMGTVSANMTQSAAAGGVGGAVAASGINSASAGGANANGKSSNNNSSKDVTSAKDGQSNFQTNGAASAQAAASDGQAK